jgi:hypothetical protein
VTTSRRLSTCDVLYAIDLALACVIGYYVAMYVVPTLFDDENHAIGASWATISAAFVFRENQARVLSVGLGRLGPPVAVPRFKQRATDDINVEKNSLR